MIKLLAVDMDGTCLDPLSRFSKATLEALYKAKAAGIEIVPTTGRALACLPHTLKEHPDLFRYVISSNGALVKDTKTQKELFRNRIPPYLIEELVHRFKKERVFAAAHIGSEYWVNGRMMQMQGRLVFGKDARETVISSDLFADLLKNKNYVEEIQLYFLGRRQKERVRALLSDLHELHGAFTPAYVEIFDKESSKGKALKKLAGHLGIEKDEIACIGDGENDVFMFEVAGSSFAMGNAEQAVKEKAAYVTRSNRENGVACAIERILTTLSKKSSTTTGGDELR